MTPDTVSVLGTGNMGGALAGRLLESGHDVTVWNRSPGRCQALLDRGATLAPDPDSAVRTSDLALVCVFDYAAVGGILGSVDSDSMAGRRLVNLTWGTDDEAVAVSSRVAAADGSYLDGSILVYPNQIGEDEAMILYSGGTQAWDDSRSLLMQLGGASLHVGEHPGDANLMGLAMSSFYHVALAAYLENAAFVKAKGDSVEAFSAVASPATRLLDRTLLEYTEDIGRRDYSTDQATLLVVLDALKASTSAMRGSGTRADFSDAVVNVSEAVVEAGHAELSFAALFEEMLRPARGNRTS